MKQNSKNLHKNFCNFASLARSTPKRHRVSPKQAAARILEIVGVKLVILIKQELRRVLLGMAQQG